MRVNPIYTYNRFISAPKKKQVSFGLIEKGHEDKIKAALPKNSDEKIPFETQWQRLKDHDAVTIRLKEDGEVYATINEGFEEMYGRLGGKGNFFISNNYLTGLNNQRQFDFFYDRLVSIDYDREHPNGSDVTHSSTSVPKDDYWERLSEALFRTN